MVVVDGKSGNLSLILSSTIVLASSMIFIASSFIPKLLGAMSAVGICQTHSLNCPKDLIFHLVIDLLLASSMTTFLEVPLSQTWPD